MTVFKCFKGSHLQRYKGARFVVGVGGVVGGYMITENAVVLRRTTTVTTSRASTRVYHFAEM